MRLNDEDFRSSVRWKRISMVPQAAMNALNPVMRIGDQVAEPAMVHLGLNKKAAIEQAALMFDHVGVPTDFLYRYAFELSGGMRQRAALAMSLVTSPDLVILDEPTSALDVLTQANIMNLMKRVKAQMDTSFILITHDIATSSELADSVAVMYAGQIVEVSDAYQFFHEPLHPYSRKLMASVPRLHAEVEPEFITGQPPSLLNPPQGCRFADRCTERFEKCDQDPPTVKIGSREVKCWLHVEE
jgi:oligopeptide/dipeptide ABC transporter ATP-binding protein